MGKSRSSVKKLWNPSEEEKAALQSYDMKLSKMVDFIRMASQRRIGGTYIHGRPGISKTHTVRQTLDLLEGKDWHHIKGKTTAVGLFEAIEGHSNKTIVLDDVSAIFDDRTGQQLLLSALDAPPEGETVRTVSYLKAGNRLRVAFSGAIIAISNLTLKGHSNAVLAALNDRYHTVHHNPSNDEVGAFLMKMASKGIKGISPVECLEVAHYLIDEVKKKGKEDLLTIRLFVDKALTYFSAWKDKDITNDWRDLVISAIDEEVSKTEHKQQPVRETIRTVKADNKEALLNIIKREPKPAVQLELARQQLGISRATFFNHKKELQVAGLLPA